MIRSLKDSKDYVYIYPLFLISMLQMACLSNKKVHSLEKDNTPILDLAYFTKNGFLILDSVNCYLNNDNLMDKLIIFKHKNDTTVFSENNYQRPIAVFINNNSSNFIIQKIAKNVIMPSNSGGMLGDPYVGISVAKNKIEVNHYGGGSSTRWNNTLWFGFNYEVNDWMLDSVSLITYTLGRKSDSITQENKQQFMWEIKDFGEIGIERFDWDIIDSLK